MHQLSPITDSTHYQMFKLYADVPGYNTLLSSSPRDATRNMPPAMSSSSSSSSSAAAAAAAGAACELLVRGLACGSLLPCRRTVY